MHTRAAPAVAWSCQKLGRPMPPTENKIFDVYTPSHWISFLKGVSLVAGLAGDKVTLLDHVAQRLRHELRGSGAPRA